MESRYYDIATATPGTCEWLLKDGTFNTWKQEHRALLWIKGHPGSGKSTLLKRAFDSVKGSQSQRGDIVLSFFFLARGSEEQKTPFGFWRSVLHQLLPFAPDTLTGLVDTFVSRSENRGGHRTSWEWHMNELRECFKSSIAEALEKRSVWLFVDALDEVGEEIARGFVDELEMFIKDLPSTRNSFRMCFTCRIFPPLGKNDEFVTILGQQNNQDVSKYIERRLYSQECTYSARIQQEITSRACGNFTWARLVLDKVLLTWRPDDSNWEAIKDQIASTHQELDLLYMNLLDDMTDASLRLIRWVCFSLRPMYPGELQSAMEADLWALNEISRDQSQPLQGDNYRDNSHEFGVMIPILSHGLAEVVTSDNGQIVQFIHESVRDFLTGEGLPRLGKCLRNALESFLILDSPVPLREAIPKAWRRMWIWLLLRLGLTKVNIGSKDNQGRTPLLWAARRGHTEIVRQLLAAGDKHADTCDVEGMSPFAWAAFNRHEDTMQSLYESGTVNINSTDSGFGYTPLIRAVLDGEDRVVKRLTRMDKGEYKIDFNVNDAIGRRALSLAVIWHNTNVAKILLHTGRCDINWKDLNGHTALFEAASRGNDELVNLFLGVKGIDIGATDNKGRTALAAAVMWKNERAALLILGRGPINHDQVDESGTTALSFAVQNCLLGVVTELLRLGQVSINSEDQFGRTVSWWATQSGNVDIQNALLHYSRRKRNPRYGDVGRPEV
ncbi:hypothetical protein H9L39_06512 [Fusarium oxysporum f. sp. albedinis]|nr:hypothetical protein H9L39_06512 [Fusarium oxysporum f. sp. albedinis]